MIPPHTPTHMHNEYDNSCGVLCVVMGYKVCRLYVSGYYMFNLHASDVPPVVYACKENAMLIVLLFVSFFRFFLCAAITTRYVFSSAIGMNSHS